MKGARRFHGLDNRDLDNRNSDHRDSDHRNLDNKRITDIGFDGEHLNSSLRQSYEYADGVMKRRATSFYQAFQQLDSKKFRDIAAIYAFCRYVDDIADGELADSKEEALAKLNQVEQEIRQLFMGQAHKPDKCKPDTSEVQNIAPRLNQGTESDPEAPKYKWWEAFANAAIRERVPLRALLLQLEGQRSDIAFRDIETVDDLILYCLQVAGSVGIMLSPMIRNQGGAVGGTDGEAKTEEAEQKWPERGRTECGSVKSVTDAHYHLVCESLGIAMQITNILRDIGEDLRTRGRVYVPKSLMKAHGVTRKDLEQLARYEASAQTSAAFTNADESKATDRMSELGHKLVVPENIKALWEEMAQVSERYYAIFFEQIDLFSEESRVSVAAAAALYRAILDAVRDNR